MRVLAHGCPWPEGGGIYELHVGLLGGYGGVKQHLQSLVEIGITAIELMPIAEFSGARNWGYDGVLPFAPESSYGTPGQLRALIDEAHSLGLMVFLDVVYNHFGPDGNWIPSYAPSFFRADLHTPWGAGIDFRKNEVRRFFIENALYWLGEFRFDGLRLDAVHAISEPDWLGEMARRRSAAAFPRPPYPSDPGERTQRSRAYARPDRRAVERRCPQCHACAADRRNPCLLRGLRRPAHRETGARAGPRLHLSG